MSSSSSFTPFTDDYPTPRLSGRFPNDPAYPDLAGRGISSPATRPTSAPTNLSADWSSGRENISHHPFSGPQWDLACDRRSLSGHRLDASASPNTFPSSPSSCSLPSPPSASTSLPNDADNAWNLIPYHVAWGPEYEEYRAGTLPGPEGDCIFLRSPTPLKNQRAVEACKKCRERKAKCSGTRPSCARCTSRGYACQYASEAEPDRGPAKNRRRRRDVTTVASPPVVRVVGDDVSSEKDYHTRDLSLKHEDDPLAFAYPLGVSPAAVSWEGSTPSDEFAMDEAWRFPEHTSSTPSDDGSLIHYQDSAYPVPSYSDELQHLHLPSDASILAPRPLRHLSSASLLGASGDQSSSASLSFDGSVSQTTFGAPLSSHYASIDASFQTPSEDAHIHYDFPPSYVSSTMSPQYFSGDALYNAQHADPYKLGAAPVYHQDFGTGYQESDSAAAPQFSTYAPLSSAYTPFPRGS